MTDARKPRLSSEKVAYWYFRLNGFLQIENFVVHPSGRGGQRTDADLLAVRFPHRAEFWFDHPGMPMPDDESGLDLSSELVDIVIAEVKTNQPCTLNGPWTREDRQNIDRVLAAIGCIPMVDVPTAAKDLYVRGLHSNPKGLRIRLVAVGRRRSEMLKGEYPEVVQVVWKEVLRFMHRRFHAYRNQKTQVDQWDVAGRRIKRLADSSRDVDSFVTDALDRMGVRP